LKKLFFIFEMCEPINRSSPEVARSKAASSSLVDGAVGEENVCRVVPEDNGKDVVTSSPAKSERKETTAPSKSRVDKWLLSGRSSNSAGSDKGGGAKILVLGEMDFTLALSLHRKWPIAEIVATALFDDSDERAVKFESTVDILRKGGQRVMFGVDATVLHENADLLDITPKFTTVLFGFPRQGVPKQTAKARKRGKAANRKKARKLKRQEALESSQNMSFFDAFLSSITKANLLVDGGILGLITLQDHYDEWEVLASAETVGFEEITEVWEGIELDLPVDFPGYQPRKETGGKFNPFEAILYLLRLRLHNRSEHSSSEVQ